MIKNSRQMASVLAARKYKERLLAELQEDKNHHMHGTTSAFSVGCKCLKCRKARSDYYYAKREKNELRRKERAAKLAADPKDHRHGTNTGYVLGCRCDRCKAASSAYHRAARARIKEMKNANANRS